MNPLRALFSSLLVSALALAASPAAANECFPACRAEYVCNPAGACVSACNPPCDGGDVCKAGACIAKVEEPEVVETKGADIVWSAGVGAHLAKEANAPLVLTSLTAAFGGGHAFLVGGHAGVAFFDRFIGTGTFTEVALKVGYRAMMQRGTVRAGVSLVFQPELWMGPNVLLGLGTTVSGILAYRRLVFQLPLSFERVATFDKHFSTSKNAFVFTPAILVGLSF